jgi:hypothetical protein
MNKLIRIIGLVLIITSVRISIAQNFPDGYTHYQGTINNNIPVILDLVSSGNRAEGFYTYSTPENNSVKSIRFIGSWDLANQQLTLKEFENPEGSFFQLRLASRGKLEGKWHPGDHVVELESNLEESYPEGSIRLTTHSKALSHTLFPMMKESPRASYLIVCPEAIAGKQREISDSINKKIASLFFNQPVYNESFTKIIEKESKRYFEMYVDQNQDTYSRAERTNTFCWDKHLNLMIFSNAKHILSFGVKQYAFTGSGKGMTVKKVANVSLRSGKTLILNDFITDPDMLSRLNTLINQKIRIQFDLSETENLTNQGFYSETIPTTDNFGITSDAFIFYYNPYEIGNASIGAIEVVVAFSELGLSH